MVKTSNFNEKPPNAKGKKPKSVRSMVFEYLNKYPNTSRAEILNIFSFTKPSVINNYIAAWRKKQKTAALGGKKEAPQIESRLKSRISNVARSVKTLEKRTSDELLIKTNDAFFALVIGNEYRDEKAIREIIASEKLSMNGFLLRSKLRLVALIKQAKPQLTKTEIKNLFACSDEEAKIIMRIS